MKKHADVAKKGNISTAAIYWKIRLSDIRKSKFLEFYAKARKKNTYLRLDRLDIFET